MRSKGWAWGNSGAYATFSNCLFRNVHLPRNAVFEFSNGAVTLINCHFSNISTGSGMVGTVRNSYDFEFPPSIDQNINNDIPVYGQDYHEAYDITISPAPEFAALAHNTEYVVVNETISDCLYQGRSGYVLPWCSEQANAESPSGSEKGQADYDSESYNDIDVEYDEWKEAREIVLGNPFYAQYYGDYVYNNSPDLAPAPVLVGRDLAPPPGDGYAPPPGENAWMDDHVRSGWGMQLSTEHPWFQAIMKVCAGMFWLCACLNGIQVRVIGPVSWCSKHGKDRA